MTSSIRYDESFPLNTLNASDAPPLIAPRQRRTGLIIGIIIGVIVLVIIIVIVIVLVLRSRARRSTNPNNGGGPGNPANTTCTNNSQCTAPRVCNTTTQRCVDCINNTQCAGSAFPVCRTDTNACVRCLTNTDCNSPNTTCSNNLCCDSTPPVINSVTSTISGDSRIQINLEIRQPLATSRVFAILEDPSGFPLINRTCSDVRGQTARISCTTAVTCPTGDLCIDQKCEVPGCVSFAAGPFVLLTESSIGIKIFPETTYRIRVKTVYDCGAIRNASTAFSQPVSFTTGACPTSPVGRAISSTEEVLRIDPNGQFVQLLVTFPIPNAAPNFLVGFVVSRTPQVHPNRAEIYVPAVQTTNGRDGFKLVAVDTPGPGIFYARAFNAGSPDSCNSALGPEFRFVTQGYFPGIRTIFGDTL